MNSRVLTSILVTFTYGANSNILDNASIYHISVNISGAQASTFHSRPVDEKKIDKLYIERVKIAENKTKALTSQPDSEVASSLARLTINQALELVVAIKYLNIIGEPKICTGEIIDENTVLTAAHCTCGIISSYRVFTDATVPAKKGDRNFFLSHKNGMRLTELPILYRPKNNPCHKPYRPKGTDLALLKVNFSPNGEDPWCGKYHSCLDGFNQSIGELLPELQRGNKVTIAGYGKNDYDEIDTLYQSKAPILSPFCVGNHYGSDCTDFNEMILGPNEKKIDTCSGDSGGPVFIQRGNEAILIAITSRGLNACGYGGIYTLLGRNSVRAWLTANGVRNARITTPRN